MFLLPVFFLFNKTNVDGLASKFMPKELTTFHSSFIIVPSPNSIKYDSFQEIKEGNLEYYSPAGKKVHLYSTFNGNLPCSNTKLIERNKRRINIRPQLRTNQLKDGFYSERLNQNE